jgi:hypothetical protein
MTPRIEQEVREVVTHGLDRVCRFSKSRWEETIHIVDPHAAHS